MKEALIIDKTELKEILKEILQELLSVQKTTAQNNLIPRKEVIINFKIAESTLNNWVKQKHLTPIKIGRKVFFNKTEIENISKN